MDFRIAIGLLAATLANGTIGAPASADPVSEFYKGNNLHLIVASGAGGGYDTYARAVARHYAKHIPGEPTVVVQNMPGAGGMTAANHLYNVAPKDGLAIGLLQNMSPFGPFYKVKQAQFEASKFNWLGSPGQEVSLFLVWHTVPVNTIADAKHRKLVLGAGGAAATGAFYARVLSSVFGVKFKLVQGYGGLDQALLAMEKGEIEGYPSVFWSTLKSTRPEWVKNKTVKPIVQWGDRPNPELKDVPFAIDLLKSEDDKRVMEVSSAPLALGRPIAAPPGVPSERVAALRAALQATFKDPGYLADCAKQRLECDNPVTGEQLANTINKAYAVPSHVRDRLIEIYQRGLAKKK
jgi:tripartite-type tricarboxylate transporter receptor subunit TctC